MKTIVDLSEFEFSSLVDSIMDRAMTVAEANNRGAASEFDLDDAVSTNCSGDETWPADATFRDVVMEISRRCTNCPVSWILSGRGHEFRTARRGD